MKTADRKFKNESLKEVCEIAKSKGYKVYTFESSQNTINQIFFVNQLGQIGTASDYFSGISFGTVHRPSQGIGTGFGIGEEFASPESLDIAFNHAPRWASVSDRQKVKKYDNWEQYVSEGRILKYYEL